MKRSATSPRLRCAIYTRKSSEEGLDQSFNSLQAQREACEAYVKSQAHEGWTALAAAYDDGGFSGGSMERPGLRRLLADIEAGRTDVVVVYKVDRLTRSLMDFAKIVEAFDAKGVSFVSVTQAFNTTTSMGRLTLNVLLSFAQFEREVTGERIRDKIAASKRKGMWMGGTLPLGYDAPCDPTTRALVVNAPEAETVRLIFRRYLELGSVFRLMDWLSCQNIRTKQRLTAKGRRLGGGKFGVGPLLHILKNRTYLGEVPHKDKSYPGAHPAIVDLALFDAVQTKLAEQNRRADGQAGRIAAALLKGLIFDADGAAMSPSFCHKPKGKLYRYYVSASLIKGARDHADPQAIRRVPAPTVEALVGEALSRLSGERDPKLGDRLVRVEIHPRQVDLVVRRASLMRRPGLERGDLTRLREQLKPGEQLTADRSDHSVLRMTLPCRLKLTGGSVRLIQPHARSALPTPDQTLIAALKAGHRLAAAAAGERLGAPETLALRSAPDDRYERKLIRLAFLAPDIQAAILSGRQPPTLNRQLLVTTPIPAAWEDQRRLFGMAPASA